MSGRKSNIAQSIHDRLLNISREKGENFNLTLKYFAYEGFLRRLQKSPHSGKFILKGGYLLMQWTREYYRTTKDVDLLVCGDSSEERIRGAITEICAIEFENDGLRFDTSEIKLEEIKEDLEYQGWRAKFFAYIGKSKIGLQIDMGFGDAITPAPVEIEYPSLLDLPSPRVLAYPIETMIAEKVEAMVKLGMGNSRMRDFYDVYSLIKTRDVDQTTLVQAITATFTRRETPIPAEGPVAFTDDFSDDPVKNTQWNEFVRKSELKNAPDDLATVIEEIKVFILPMFDKIHKEGKAQ